MGVLIMKIREYLDSCSDNKVVELWNEYCDIEQCTDDMCYDMGQFDDIVDTDYRPFGEVFKQLNNGFDFKHDVFWFDGLGYISSGYNSDFINSVVDLDSLANSIE